MSFDRTEYQRKAAAMKDAQAQDVTLPSGALFRLRRPKLQQWLTLGRLPKTMVAALMPAEGRSAALTDEDILEVSRFVREFILATVVSPRIPDELPIEDLADEDVDFIYQWATRQQEVAALETFPERSGPAAGGADGADVPPAAQRAAGN